MSGVQSRQQPAAAAAAVRVAVRCSWSGARLAVPASPPLTPRTDLAAVVAALVAGGSLPASILDDGGATLVYARTAVPRDRWEGTTLGDLAGSDGGISGGGVMLVLHLGGRGGNSAAGRGGAGGGRQAASAAPAAADTAAAAAADTAAASATTSAATSSEPMDIDAAPAPAPAPAPPLASAPTPTPAIANATPAEEAVATLLSSNLDADLRPCLVTLLKILDNLVGKPHEPKVRTIRLSNAAFAGRVGRCRGAVEVLEGCGFVRESRAAVASSRFGNDNNNSSNNADADVIVLPPDNEDTASLISVRHLLAQKAVQVVGMDERDLPKYKGPPRPVVPVDPSSSAAGGGGGSAGTGTATTFDPYKAHSYNAQAAASGAADPRAIGGGGSGSGGNGMSRTEKELRALQSKQERLERRLQKLGPGGRALAAFRPVSGGSIGAGPSPPGDHGGGGGAGGGKSDGSLLAARMKRLEEERRKREEGGFTTRAMRDLESMKKAKVYAHATLRVGFADGCWIAAKFLPGETVEAVRTVLREECFREDMAGALDFDLYVAPPRRRLDGSKRLDAEGLVPAARVHVSWKVGGAPPAPAKGQVSGSYLREELFRNDGGADETAAAFPNSQKLVDDDANGKKEGGKKRPAGNGAGTAAASAESREEALMARMLGKKPGLLGGRSGGDASKEKSSGGKPKWFK